MVPAAHVAAVTSMSTTAAALGVSLALMAGWYGRKWWQAEDDENSLRIRHGNAVKGMWRSRWVLVFVVIAVWATANLWVHGQGR